MCVFIFCTTFIWKISHYKQNSVRYCHKCEKSSSKVPVILVGFWLSLSFKTDFREKLKFHENPSSVSGVVPCGRTDGSADVVKLVVAFRYFANAPEKWITTGMQVVWIYLAEGWYNWWTVVRTISKTTFYVLRVVLLMTQVFWSVKPSHW